MAHQPADPEPPLAHGTRVRVEGGMGDYDIGTVVEQRADGYLLAVDNWDGSSYPQWVNARYLRPMTPTPNEGASQ